MTDTQIIDDIRLLYAELDARRQHLIVNTADHDRVRAALDQWDWMWGAMIELQASDMVPPGRMMLVDPAKLYLGTP